MKCYQILILASNTAIHKSITHSLLKNGHHIKHVDSCVQLLHESRRIRPDLVLVEYTASDSSLDHTLRIIKTDRISSVVLLIKKLDEPIVNQMEKSHFSNFIPVDTPSSLIARLVEIYASQALERASYLEKIDQLEGDIADRKIIDQAKRHLMKKWNLPEDQAYKILRKRSMDQSKNMANIAQEILTHSG